MLPEIGNGVNTVWKRMNSENGFKVIVVVSVLLVLMTGIVGIMDSYTNTMEALAEISKQNQQLKKELAYMKERQDSMDEAFSMVVRVVKESATYAIAAKNTLTQDKKRAAIVETIIKYALIVNPELEPETAHTIAATCYEEGLKRDIDPFLLAAIIKEESDFVPTAEGDYGEYGLMQLMPSTARMVAQALGYENFDLNKLYDPKINIEFGAYHYDNERISALRMKETKEEVRKLTLLFYNRGIPNVLDDMSEGKDPSNGYYEGVMNVYDYLRMGG